MKKYNRKLTTFTHWCEEVSKITFDSLMYGRLVDLWLGVIWDKFRWRVFFVRIYIEPKQDQLQIEIVNHFQAPGSLYETCLVAKDSYLYG